MCVPTVNKSLDGASSSIWHAMLHLPQAHMSINYSFANHNCLPFANWTFWLLNICHYQFERNLCKIRYVYTIIIPTWYKGLRVADLVNILLYPACSSTLLLALPEAWWLLGVSNTNRPNCCRDVLKDSRWVNAQSRFNTGCKEGLWSDAFSKAQDCKEG